MWNRNLCPGWGKRHLLALLLALLSSLVVGDLFTRAYPLLLLSWRWDACTVSFEQGIPLIVGTACGELPRGSQDWRLQSSKCYAWCEYWKVSDGRGSGHVLWIVTRPLMGVGPALVLSATAWLAWSRRRRRRKGGFPVGDDTGHLREI